MRRHWRSLAALALVVVGIVLVVGLVWLNDLADPTVEATAAMGSDAAVSVSSDGDIEFQPAEPATTGFILYPGARVAPEAYAPLARAIAEAGHLAVITPMPFGLAVLSPDAAAGVIADHPEIERWVVGGHSLGGAMAAQYAAGHEDLVDGLVLWAAYPAEGTDLSATDLAVASISASEDGLASPEEIAASAARLPADTSFVEIEGGNHAGFGSYGAQSGDGEATISAADQQAQTVAATLAVLEAVSAGVDE
jgi:dienelactone hydrolase